MTKQEYIEYLQSEYKLAEAAKGTHTWHGGCEFMLRQMLKVAKDLDEPETDNNTEV